MAITKKQIAAQRLKARKEKQAEKIAAETRAMLKERKVKVETANAVEKLKEIKKQQIIILEKMKKYREENKLEFFDKYPNPGPNLKQAELFEAWMNGFYKVFAYLGGNRSGKTTAGSIIAVSTVIGEWPWNKKKLPFPHNNPRKVRIVGQDWEKHIKAVVIPELYKWWPKNREVTIKKNSLGIESMWIDVKTGGSIEVMSNNQESDLHEGWSGDLIYYDEPPKRDIRIANARGLVDRQGREIFCMTLLKEAWVDREVVKAVLDNGQPDPTVYSIHCTTFDNVGFGITQEGIAQFAKTLTEEEKQARLMGIPQYMQGLVYGDFQRKVHVKPRFQIPLDWIVDIAIDIHPRKQQAILFIATAPDDRRYVCDEVWEHGDGTWVGEEVIRRIKRNAYRVGRIIIDPLSKADANNEETVYAKIDKVLMRHGYMLEVACKEKDSGILEVKKHLKGPNGEPSIFFFNDLIRTLYEIEAYMWDKETQKASKVDDDMMENLYRLCLLGTNWVSEDEEEGNYGDDRSDDTRNRFTGY